MLKTFTIPTCLAVGLTVAAGPTNAQIVREGVRRTGEAVVESGRAVTQGTRNAIGRAGQATRNVIDNTTDAARARVRLERSQLQQGVAADVDSDLNTRAEAGSAQIQAGAGINANQQLDGSVQAPLPGDPNDPAMQGEYQAGYRGLNDQAIASGQASYQGRAYRLRHDRNGREFICVNGRAVYFDNQQGGQPEQHEAYKLSDDQMMNQERDQQQQGQMDHQSRQYQDSAQSGTYVPQGAPPAPPVPIRSDLNSAAPASPSLNADTDISAEQRTELNESTDVDAGASVDTSADTNARANNADANADASAEADLDTDANSSDSSADASVDASADRPNDSSGQSNDSDESNN